MEPTARLRPGQFAGFRIVEMANSPPPGGIPSARVAASHHTRQTMERSRPVARSSVRRQASGTDRRAAWVLLSGRHNTRAATVGRPERQVGNPAAEVRLATEFPPAQHSRAKVRVRRKLRKHGLIGDGLIRRDRNCADYRDHLLLTTLYRGWRLSAALWGRCHLLDRLCIVCPWRHRRLHRP